MSLSNFVFFDSNQDPNSYFSNEGGHVVYLENEKVFDHSSSDEQFTFCNSHIRACLNASQLFRVGETCTLEHVVRHYSLISNKSQLTSQTILMSKSLFAQICNFLNKIILIMELFY